MEAEAASFKASLLPLTHFFYRAAYMNQFRLVLQHTNLSEKKKQMPSQKT
jgi:hypothetical protein